VMVDDEMRDFIQRGLSLSGFNVVGLGGEVEKVKQTKTPREIELIRAVNTGTAEAVRAMRKCMYPGLTENEVMNVLDDTLRAAGLEPFFDIVLFGTFPPLPLPEPVTELKKKTKMLRTPTAAQMGAKCWKQRHSCSSTLGLSSSALYPSI